MSAGMSYYLYAINTNALLYVLHFPLHSDHPSFLLPFPLLSPHSISSCLYPHIFLFPLYHSNAYRQVTIVYGFYDECIRKYGSTNAWRYCAEVFDALTLACVIEDSVLCVHGGLSPSIGTLDDIRLLNRNEEIPHEGPFCDLMWSDPESDIEEWAVSQRGAGFVFGGKVATLFNHINGLELICRAHQLVLEGYAYKFPKRNLVTVWSAPNYCYRCDNVASILKFDEYLDRQCLLFREVKENREAIVPDHRIEYFI